MTKEDTKDAPNLGMLEEGDEFEEFPVEEWKDEDIDQSDLQVWDDDWDDDKVEDDFSKQLKAELEKKAMQ